MTNIRTLKVKDTQKIKKEFWPHLEKAAKLLATGVTAGVVHVIAKETNAEIGIWDRCKNGVGDILSYIYAVAIAGTAVEIGSNLLDFNANNTDPQLNEVGLNNQQGSADQ